MRLSGCRKPPFEMIERMRQIERGPPHGGSADHQRTRIVQCGVDRARPVAELREVELDTVAFEHRAQGGVADEQAVPSVPIGSFASALAVRVAEYAGQSPVRV